MTEDHKHDTFGMAVSRDEGSERVSYHTCSVCGKEMGEYLRVPITGSTD
jgi:hypothetical protein